MKNIAKKQELKSLIVAKNLFGSHGGILSTSEAIRCGIHPRTLYAMRDSGVVEQLSRGLYRLADLPPLSHPDLISVALKVPRGVICLISALAYHELTTQIPHEVYLALKRGTQPPRLSYPPVRVFWFTDRAFREGIATQTVDGIKVHVYNPEKTVVDCFKYRHKIGLDIALEALKLYLKRPPVQLPILMKYASVCRVEQIIRPYLEALL